MSMTREEAVAEINSAISCALMGAMLPNKQYLKALEALSILAPEPRKEPPTVDEVGDDEDCWAMDDDSDQWSLMKGSFVRAWFGTNGMIPLRQWLPYSALPKGDV